MTPFRETGRCVCGCPRETHDHFRRGSDCGRCGAAVCCRFVPLRSRDTAPLTTAQRVALAQSDAQVYRTLMALLAGGHVVRRPPVQVPAQRDRRSVFDAAKARAVASQNRNRGNKPKR